LESGVSTRQKGGLIWYTEGSKANKGTGAGVYCYGTRRKLNFDFGQYTTIFQAEVHAIKACAYENIDRKYKNRNICILSDSQAAIKELHKYQITSKLICDCYQSLKQLAKRNRLQLIWVPGHEGIVGNETADQLAKTGSEHPFIGPEPACGMSVGVAKKAVRDWTNRNQKKDWQSVTGLTQAKGLTQRSSAGRTKDLLRLNRGHLRWV
jgi:ribonuclease HI